MIRPLAASFLALAALGLFVGPSDAPAGHRHRRRCQPACCSYPTGNPQVCLEDLLYADPDNNYYFWDGDRYQVGYPNCAGQPDAVYYETDQPITNYPESCAGGTCLADKFVVAQVPQGLRGRRLPANVHPIDTIKDPHPNHPNIHPKRWHFAAGDQWLIVDLGGGQEINVRLFDMFIDFDNSGYQEPRPRSHYRYFGLEADGNPNDPTHISVNQVRRYRGSKKAFQVTLNGHEYTVFTFTEVYHQ